MQLVSYIFFRLWVGLFSLIPLPLLYKVSDYAAWMMHNILNYRSQIIDKNLSLCFPEKNDKEKSEIKSQCYKNLCDIILESFKGFSMSPEQIKERYIIEKPTFIDQLYADQKNIVLYGSHIGNWEWATYTFPLFYDHKIIGMIKPVKNKYINKYTNNKRCSTGTKVIDIYKKDRSLLAETKDPFLVVYIADQNPSDDINSLIVDFFDIQTHCLHGAEKSAIKNNWPAVFMKTRRTKRGYYVLSPILLTDLPQQTQLTEITQMYFHELEKSIKEKPGDWLWTHKRWKRNIKY